MPPPAPDTAWAILSDCWAAVDEAIPRFVCLYLCWMKVIFTRTWWFARRVKWFGMLLHVLIEKSRETSVEARLCKCGESSSSYIVDFTCEAWKPHFLSKSKEPGKDFQSAHDSSMWLFSWPSILGYAVRCPLFTRLFLQRVCTRISLACLKKNPLMWNRVYNMIVSRWVKQRYLQTRFFFAFRKHRVNTQILGSHGSG